MKSNMEPLENQLETFHNKIPLLLDSWKPCSGGRAVIKGWLLKLRLCLGAVCGIKWYGYAILGISAAILSYFMDLSVTKLSRAHQLLYEKLEGNFLLQFLCWTLYPACNCAFACFFSHSICPFSTGSGIPEVRTMLAGFELPHYLSLTNMFTKYLGLISVLAAGSTVFLGKVGPFVHLSTMLGAYVNNLLALIQGNKKEGAEIEMMTVAAAVGVASCFAAPISGVLFSVEVMSNHFAIKHYCPCFFSAVCGALTFRLLAVWSGEEETLQALFKTNFPTALPFYPLEILLFALLGKTLYSGLVVFCLASLTFPHSAGQYMASKYSMKQLLISLLDSRQWCTHSYNTTVPLDPLLEWSSSGTSIFLSLPFFLLMKMWMLVLACTLPLPAGYFLPVFIYGAAIGRLLGEGVAYVSTKGVILGPQWASLNPGGYALAGAAALSGAATHTLSPALLAVELTGQFSYIIPVLLCTLIANGITRRGNRPSFYDALSIIKKLPHLPSLVKASPRLPSTPVGQVLGGNLVWLQRSAGPAEVRCAINSCTEEQIAVVDTNDVLMFLGFVLRSELLTFLHQSLNQNEEKHLDEVCCIHPSKVLISPHNTVEEVYGLLSLSGGQTLFVTDAGKLVGYITWPKMKQIFEDLAKEI